MALGTASGRKPAAPSGTAFRAACESDVRFFHVLYASTRAEELAATSWPPEAIDRFLAQQAAAQHAHYARHYAGAGWWVLERRREPIGRWPGNHRIVDIALLPEARGHGLGTAIVADVIAAADAAGAKVSIHVEKANPVMRLYRRLGFVPVEDKGVYDLLERTANHPGSPRGGSTAVPGEALS